MHEAGLDGRSRALLERLKKERPSPERRLLEIGSGLPPDQCDHDNNPDLAWGAGECAAEVFGADTRKNRKRIFDWRAEVKAARSNPEIANCANPGFVFFKDKNAVVLSRRAFRAYVANLLKEGCL
jgi:hypothetical protein